MTGLRLAPLTGLRLERWALVQVLRLVRSPAWPRLPFAWLLPLLLLLLLLFGAGVVSCTRAQERPKVVLYAAASTADAVGEVARGFEAEHGVVVRTSFSASSTAAQQIERGAPAALYLSASKQWMDRLARRNLIEPRSRTKLLTTRLALIAPRGEAFRVSLGGGAAAQGVPLAQAFEGRLALGDPEHVPAGIYAKQALQRLGWWQGLASRVVAAHDARSALAFVERGECAAGIVYDVDARRSRRVERVALLPASSHDRIVYELATVRGQGSAEARALHRYLLGAQAQRIFRRHGFALIHGGDSGSRRTRGGRAGAAP